MGRKTIGGGLYSVTTAPVAYVVESHLGAEGRRQTFSEAEALRHHCAETRAAFAQFRGIPFTWESWEASLGDLEIYPLEVPA